MRISSVTILCVLFLIGCSVKKRAVPTVDVPELSTEQIMRKVSAQQRAYDWVEMKGKIKFNDEDNKFSGSIHIRSKSDSIVWVRIKKLGVEGARILADTASLTVINRIDKNVAQQFYETVSDQAGMSLSIDQLTGLLSGSFYAPDGALFTNRIDSQQYVLDAQWNDLVISHKIRAYDFELSESAIYDQEGRGVRASYYNYEWAQDSTARWPMLREYEIYDGKVVTNIQLNIKDLYFDGPYNTPFAIPPHYERIP